MEETILKRRATPGDPTFNRGIGFLYRHYKGKEGFEKLTLDGVRQILRKNRGYTLHKPYKRQKTFNPTFSHEPRELIQMDLMEMQYWKGKTGNRSWTRSLKHANNGVCYLSVAIDAYTRYVCVVPLKNKTAKSVLEAVKLTRLLFLSSRPDIPRWKRVYFDAGSEYKSNLMTNYLKSEKISFSYSFSERKASIVERALGTLKVSIYKMMTETRDYNYIKHLDRIVDSYNNASHSFFKHELTPSEAEKRENKHLVDLHHASHYHKILRQRKKAEFKVGDIVRRHVGRKKLGNRGFHHQFSEGLYRVTRVNSHLPITTYDISSLETGVTYRSFYPKELSAVDYKDVYKPRKIISRRINRETGVEEAKVLFEDFENPIWVKSSDIVVK